MAEVQKKPPVKIDQKIIGYKVITDDNIDKKEGEDADGKLEQEHEIEYVHEGLKRPVRLYGTTYKLKPMGYDSALYVTINDIIMNKDTKHEQNYPYEVFLNSKRMESFQWIIALTRVVSSTFRKGGNITFLVEELEQVFDPKGGYWGKDYDVPTKGKFYNSVVAELGSVVKHHMTEIGLIDPPPLTIKEENDLKNDTAPTASSEKDTKDIEIEGEVYSDKNVSIWQKEHPGQVASKVTCPECSEPHMQLLDGCYTCVNGCGHSKCG